MTKEFLILLFLLIVLIGIIYLLYAIGIFKRRVVVTTIKNLPLGIFKDNISLCQQETVEVSIQENSESDENRLMECNNEDNFKKEFSSESLEILKDENIQKIKNSNIQGENIVYWTPQGKHYHKMHNCSTLIRSKVVNSGSIDKSGKLTGCHKCNIISFNNTVND